MDVRSQATIRRCCCFQGSEGDKPTKLITSVRGRWCDFLRRLKNTSPHARPFQGDQPTVSSRLSRLSLLSLSFCLSLYARRMKSAGEREEDTGRKAGDEDSREGIRKDYSKDYSALALSRVLLAGRLARISLDLISFWPGRLREAAVAPRVERTTGETLGALCIILILCATPREKARGIRIRGGKEGGGGGRGSRRCTRFPSRK